MKSLDYFIQWLRIREAGKYIRAGSVLLDIGCADGAIFRQLAPRLSGGLGLDPGIPESRDFGSYQLLRGRFPEAVPAQKKFDVITLLAVLEHIPHAGQEEIAKEVPAYLKPGGRLIISVPDPMVDRILDLLLLLHLIDGMSLEEHYGFDSASVPRVFAASGLKLIKTARFEFGLNNLYVFER